MTTETRMNMIEATKTCFRKYFVMRGRARRAEFWWFYLATFILTSIATLFDVMLFGFEDEDPTPISSLVTLAVFIPTITAAVRRLHDTGKPGYYIFAPVLLAIIGIGAGAALITSLGGAGAIIAGVIVAAGLLLQLYWMVQKSDPDTNKYGPNPITNPDGQNVSEVFE